MSGEEWTIGDRLDEHIRECREDKRMLSEKLDRYHEENKASIRRLYGSAWAAVGAIIGALCFIIYSLLHTKGTL